MHLKSKYQAQMKYLRKNYIRFPLDLKPEILESFKRTCALNNTTPTTELKKFIARYVAHGNSKKDLVEIEVELPQYLETLAQQKQIDLTDILVNALVERYLEKEGEKKIET